LEAAIFRLPGEAPVGGDWLPSVEYRVGTVRSHEDQSARDLAVREVLSTGVARTRELTYEDGVSTLFCLPLNTARETVGALCFRLRQGTRLDEEKLGMLQAFGDAAALAIDNARLYQEALAGIETKTTLVQEMHHRVRNNLQTVAALLSLQLRSEPDAPWTFELGEAVSRIQAIAGVHDLMSDESRLADTTVDVLARMVAEEAHSTLTPPGLTAHYEIPPSDLRVPSRQATIIALLINELTANAIHHGFKGRAEGVVRISAREERGYAVITVFNDGAKIPPEFDPEKSDGLGMRITQRLVSSDLRGVFTIEPTAEGTVATIRFPISGLRDDQDSLGA
jgi:two-component sensor histidine kinase